MEELLHNLQAIFDDFEVAVIRTFSTLLPTTQMGKPQTKAVISPLQEVLLDGTQWTNLPSWDMADPGEGVSDDLICQSGESADVGVEPQDNMVYPHTMSRSEYHQDTVIHISLLKTSVLNEIKASERCCFLLRLLGFYLNNVFPNIEFDSGHVNRSCNQLANSLLGFKIELKQCHATMRCPCGEQSHSVIEDFKEEFYKLDTEAATVKAVGDLNILFHWMKKNFLP
ncbi:interleukin-20-like [Bombina bombina]|uniref:interleukin-20-like n=1 Tax=Bombina bombina TaxID=8345 RepID=UPI00235AEAF6|nr:interleukin-20-like [Bombina bombina]